MATETPDTVVACTYWYFERLSALDGSFHRGGQNRHRPHPRSHQAELNRVPRYRQRLQRTPVFD